MKSLKYPIFLVLSVFIVLTACKKSRQPKTDETPAPYPTENDRYVPIKLETADFTVNLKYKENTDLLEEVTDSDDNKTTVTYTPGKHLYKLEKYRNGNLFYVVYYEQTDGGITSKALIFDYENLSHHYNPRGFYTITYNEQQKITAVNYYNTTNNLIRTNTLLYTGSTNLSEINTTEYPGATTITSYTFDQRKGISSNITNNELFTAELGHWFFLCADNNLLTISSQKSSQESTSFSYEYNENGYPSSAQFTNSKSTQRIKITYKRLAP